MSEEPIIILSPGTLRRVLAPSPRRKLFVLVGAVTLVAVAILVTLLLTLGSGGSTYVVRRGDIVLSFVGIGRVEADPMIEIVPKIIARIQEIHVREGDIIKSGQLLVTLEDSALKTQYDEASRACDAVKARLDELLRGTRPEDLSRAKARVEEAEHALRVAEAQRAETLRGARPEEREAAEASLALAQADADFATREFERANALLKEGTISQREYDEARRKHDTAQAALRQAQARRDLVCHGATEEVKEQARAAAEAARARLEQERAMHERLTKGASDEERRTAEAELKQAEAVVARLEFELSQAKLTSPIDGVVARRYKEPSELGSPGMPSPILVLAATNTRSVRIEVLETDVFKLRLGQQATITSDAYPGHRWSGRIAHIAPTMGRKRLFNESPKEKTDVKVLEVKIVPEEPLDLPLNLAAEAKICEVTRQGVLRIPTRLLVGTDGVRASDDSIHHVELGARDDTYVEVLSGLTEGERIHASPR